LRVGKSASLRLHLIKKNITKMNIAVIFWIACPIFFLKTKFQIKITSKWSWLLHLCQKKFVAGRYFFWRLHWLHKYQPLIFRIAKHYGWAWMWFTEALKMKKRASRRELSAVWNWIYCVHLHRVLSKLRHEKKWTLFSFEIFRCSLMGFRKRPTLSNSVPRYNPFITIERIIRPLAEL